MYIYTGFQYITWYISLYIVVLESSKLTLFFLNDLFKNKSIVNFKATFDTFYAKIVLETFKKTFYVLEGSI